MLGQWTYGAIMITTKVSPRTSDPYECSLFYRLHESVPPNDHNKTIDPRSTKHPLREYIYTVPNTNKKLNV